MSASQFALNAATMLGNGLFTLALGYLIDRKFFQDGGQSSLLNAILVSSLVMFVLWFVALWFFGKGPNFLGALMMGGGGSTIAFGLGLLLRPRVEAASRNRSHDRTFS